MTYPRDFPTSAGIFFGLGLVTVDNDIKGVIADGSTDFAVADGFDITVAAGAGKYVRAVSTAGDGSAKPVAILGDDVDATSADRAAPAYFSGEFAAGTRAVREDARHQPGSCFGEIASRAAA
jgi:hypothetical protein